MRTLKAKLGNPPSRAFYYDGDSYPNRGMRITGVGQKAAMGCTGKFPIPCRTAFPVSRFCWCEVCKK